ncbi:MAG: hypothetical protein HYW91_02560 [Candidatus Sungbacteria bacterium]|nr:hypothetical protein [Candidatus Sungbacteria bacterium]
MRVRLNGMEISLRRKIMRGKEKQRKRLWRRERLMIRSGMPDTYFSQFMFSQLGLMHLIAPYLPKVITTDFGIVRQIRQLIAAMYRFEGKRPPEFRGPDGRTYFALGPTDQEKVLVPYSGGKDGMYHMYWAMNAFGPENVMAVHISGLNPGNTSGEREFSARQAKAFGFRHFRTIDLLNGSPNIGYAVMRSRDMFIVALLVPLALEFGASKIIIEGFAEVSRTEPFTGQEKNMLSFNKVLRELRIPVQAFWRNDREMDVVREMFTWRPDWMPLVHNCFTTPNRKLHLREVLFNGRYPHFPPYKSQCGLCVKCRIINLLGRILWEESEEMKRLRTEHREEVAHFLKRTAEWVRHKWKTHHDMIGGSFLTNFRVAARLYGVNLGAFNKFLAGEVQQVD